jgi:predicted acetyltransferase
MNITLRWPNTNDIKEIKKSCEEPWEDNFAFLHYFDSLANSSFDKYIQILPHLGNRTFLPTGHVPCTFLLAFNELNEVVGRVSIRHELDANLSKVGGHIGYGVTPSHRKKGYATLILSETLRYIKKNLLHLTEVLLTCDDDNLGSIKTIEKNGGRFIDKFHSSELKTSKRRYKIIMPQIRRATLYDAAAIHEAHMKSIQEVCYKDHSQDEIMAWGNRPFDESMRNNATQNDFVWVVEFGDEIEGFGHFKIIEKDDFIKGHIWGLYLTKKALGFGLGKEIVHLMIDEANKMNLKIITLESSITAFNFYKKLNFQDTGPMQTLMINGQKIRCFPMEMRLI